MGGVGAGRVNVTAGRGHRRLEVRGIFVHRRLQVHGSLLSRKLEDVVWRPLLLDEVDPRPVLPSVALSQVLELSELEVFMSSKVEADQSAVETLLAEFNEKLRAQGRPDFSLLDRCPVSERKELLSLMNVSALAFRALAPERQAYAARRAKRAG
jgi:hypothetical protein